MNLINRLIVVLGLLLALIGAPLLIVGILFARGTLRGWVEPTLRQLGDANTNLAQAVCVGILTLLFAFALLLLLLEMHRPEAKRLYVESVQGAEVTLTADAIVRRLEYEIDSLADVIKVRPVVSTNGRGKPVDVLMDLLLSPEADITTKTVEATGIARRVIEDRLGLKVGKIQVKVDHAKMPKALPAKKVG